MNPVSEVTARESSWDTTAVCPLCRGVVRPWFSRGERHYERCSGCGLLSVPEGLAVDAAGVSIYESQDDSVFEADGNDGYYFDLDSNLANCRRKLLFIESYLPGGARLLDAGANFGHFLKVAESAYQASGFELSPSAVAWSRRSFGVANVVGSVYHPPTDGMPWDAVTCWDVVEHLADPRAALRRLGAVLRPQGWLFLSTPDAGSLVARILGRRWHYLDPVQHIAVFSRSNLRTLLEQAGYEVVTMAALGHSYRIRYVFDRLCYLHPRGALGMSLRVLRALSRPLAAGSVYLQLGDVLAVAARWRG
jgi:2-polyprenyl-3-methyl-5-hydroxy-6-metoxy-1,4-benzoquinol methylase